VPDPDIDPLVIDFTNSQQPYGHPESSVMNFLYALAAMVNSPVYLGGHSTCALAALKELAGIGWVIPTVLRKYLVETRRFSPFDFDDMESLVDDHGLSII
jgi:hypothetical protein